MVWRGAAREAHTRLLARGAAEMGEGGSSMKMRIMVAPATVAAALSLTPAAAPAANYVEDFDTDSTAEWNVNQPGGANASDNFADLFFDYSTVGIPSAPNSLGGTTRGIKLEANVSAGVFSGISASPIGQSVTGNYTL